MKKIIPLLAGTIIASSTCIAAPLPQVNLSKHLSKNDMELFLSFDSESDSIFNLAPNRLWRTKGELPVMPKVNSRRIAAKLLTAGYITALFIGNPAVAMATPEPTFFKIDADAAAVVLHISQQDLVRNLDHIEDRMRVIYPLISMPKETLPKEVAAYIRAYEEILNRLRTALVAGKVSDAATFNDYIVRAISALGDDHISVFSTLSQRISGAIFTPTSPMAPSMFNATLGFDLEVWQNPKTFEKFYWFGNLRDTIEVVPEANTLEDVVTINSKEQLEEILSEKGSLVIESYNGIQLKDYLYDFFKQYIGTSNKDSILRFGEEVFANRPLVRFPLGSDHGESSAKLRLRNDRSKQEYEIRLKWNLENQAPIDSAAVAIYEHAKKWEKHSNTEVPDSPYLPKAIKIGEDFEIHLIRKNDGIAAYFSPESFNNSYLDAVNINELFEQLKLLKSIGVDIQTMYFDVSENPGGDLNKARKLATLFLEEDLPPEMVYVHPNLQSFARISGLRNLYSQKRPGETNPYQKALDSLAKFQHDPSSAPKLFEFEITPSEQRRSENLQDIGITPVVIVNENSASAAEYFAGYAQSQGVLVLGTSEKTRGLLGSIAGTTEEGFSLTGLAIRPTEAVHLQGESPEQSSRYIFPDKVINAKNARAFWNSLGVDIFKER